MPDSPTSFDVIILGAGPAGEVAAGKLASGGLNVAIVEPELVGGECSFWACMPSKGLLHPDQALGEARRTAGAREAVSGGVDVAAALARRDEIIHDLDDAAQLPWLERQGITLLRGTGVLDGDKRVLVDGQPHTATRAVIVATGSTATLPSSIEGLAEAAPWTNREATTAKAAPASLIVLGGGPVGSELAQAWRTLGSAVTLVEGGPRVLGREEPFASAEVEKTLRDQGIEVHTGTHVTKVARGADGTITATLDGGATLTADELLVALGRTPRTEGIGLERLGLEGGGKPLEVDDHLLAHGDWLFAIGDVNGRSPFTHQGKEQARCAASHILGDPDCVPLLDAARSPRVTFTEPQVAAVGLTEAAAREQGIDVRTAEADVNDTAGATFAGQGVPGTCKIVVDAERQVLVGATFTGAGVEAMLHAATIAVAGEVPLHVLRHAVPAFPTRSEVWLQLWDALDA